MIERLYQPDYSCIFGDRYSNAFQYGKVDSLVWPIFIDVEKKSEKLRNLLNMNMKDGRNYFYTRKISIDDLKIELECSNIDFVLLQAMDIDRSYGISNTDVLNSVKKYPNIFKVILSYSFSNSLNTKDMIFDIEEKKQRFPVVGLALYPSYAKINLNGTPQLKEIFQYCLENDIFIKIDLGNHYLPQYYPNYINEEILRAFISKYPQNIIILSNLDISRDFIKYYPLFKFHKNLWCEITPLSFGGLTPKNGFNQIFGINGLIQNLWNRIMIGSTTPTLEISQMVRGFEEAIQDLKFAQKCILKTWLFRNVNRINSTLFQPIKNKDSVGIKKLIKIEDESIIENSNEVIIDYKLKLRSYSITQLLFLTNLISQITQKSLDKYPNLHYGEILIRSYHTTTTLIVNEHEFGNYLDLHFKFAEISRKDSQDAFHTVNALENRADFNRYDHDLATTYGSRQLILPIVDRKLEIGGRENFYILVTFGPRVFNLFFRIKLFKIN
ncbi:MAG: hypothetical protein EU550_01845 [Promethearchaeota archaeon]|nr:MAG: hypothetical protein EU550_01845 [Candidatus Lokiarchaeota archaeon]